MRTFIRISRKSSFKRLPAMALFLSLMLPLCAESFRAGKVCTLSVSAAGTVNSITAGVNDCIIVELPDDMTFVEGLELNFKLPTEIASKKESVSWAFYDGIFPSPAQGNLEYSGIKMLSGTFGGSYSLNMKIPLKDGVHLKKDNYSYIAKSVPAISDGKIFLRIHPSPKFSEADFTSTQIKVSGKAIHANMGKLSIEATYPKGEHNPYTVFVDGSSADGENLLLPPGIHTVSLVSDHYRNEQRTVTIEQGKHHVLRIELKSVTPVIRISAPEGTKVYMDGNFIQNVSTPIEVSQGDHNIRFVFGNYETVKGISVLNGCNYTVSVILDATISEEN